MAKVPVPELVADVCRRLRGEGYEAWTVGGAVRDALIGRPSSDWDVASSATPAQTTALFRHVIPTGEQHGTVTVMVGRGAARRAVEVTTFRGEGAYVDGRRPLSVRFGVGLEEDLARRDFVINAIAYDPISDVFADPFGGQADIAARVIRAVGTAEHRFQEDGLRILRAVRFAAVLEFDIDPATTHAIPAGLPSLAKVSNERVRVEWLKMLGASQPSRGMNIAVASGIVDLVFPELSSRTAAEWETVCKRLDASVDPVVALGLQLMSDRDDDASEAAERIARRLTLSNIERARTVAIVRYGRPTGWSELSDYEFRLRMSRAGRRYLDDILCAAEAFGGSEAKYVVAKLGEYKKSPLEAKDLAVTGGQVIRELGLAPGPQIGDLMRLLLDTVLRDPARNTRENLLSIARTSLNV